MINERQVITEHSKKYCHSKYISWSAIIIGAFVAIGLSFLLNVFGLAISLSAFTTNAGATTLAVGGFIGMLIGTIASMFVAGWVAGYLSRFFCFHRNLGVLYGFATWCLALILTLLLASSASHFISARYYSLSDPTGNIVHVTDNASAPIVSQQTTAHSNSNINNTQTTVNAPKALALSLFIMFILFFIGALSSCFGGYFGYKPRDMVCGKIKDNSTLE